MKAPTLKRRIGANPLAAAMTPMIDVVFLLLVFFLCTASFEPQEENLAASLLIAATESGAGNNEQPPEIDDVTLVGTHRQGVTTWIANGSRATKSLAELTEILRALVSIDAALPVTIDAGPQVPMNDVIGAYDTARAAGFHQVQLAADALSNK